MTLASAGPPYEDMRRLIAQLSGTDWPCYWADEIATMTMGSNGFIELTEHQIIPLAIDEYRRVYDPVTDTQTMAILGNRKWVFQVKVVSFIPKNVRSSTILEKIKLRLGKPNAYNQYAPLGLSMITWGSTTLIPYKADNRMLQAAIDDLTWGFRSVDADMITGSEGVIQTVNGSTPGVKSDGSGGIKQT